MQDERRGTPTPAPAARRPPPWWSIAVLAAVVVVGVVVRVDVLRQSLFGDELQTWWVVTRNGPRDLLEAVFSDAELTPPSFFVLSKVTTQLGQSFEMLRLPSLVAGLLTIPAVHALGLRAAGRPVAMLATALTALSPFMVYYSTEARAYGVLLLFVVVSAWAMLAAVDTGRRRWWVLHAVAVAGVMYAHYTGVFVLVAQLGWVLWAHPAARRAAILATAGAIVLYLPWVPGALADVSAPTQKLLTALLPFTAEQVWVSLWHWALGYPYPAVPLLRVPGIVGLVALGLALGGGVVAVVRRARARGATPEVLAPPAGGAPDRREARRRVGLLVLLMVATPVGEALVSATGGNLFSVRNLAASWPGLVLAFSTLVVASGPRVRPVLAALALLGLGLGTVGMLRVETQRPRYPEATAYVDRIARPGDVVLDETGVLSPGPLTGYDVSEPRPRPVVRSLVPSDREVPWRVIDRRVPPPEAQRAAIREADGARVLLVGVVSVGTRRLPAPYRAVAERRWPGLVPIRVVVYAPAG